MGGVWTAGECAADPVAFCEALVQRLREMGGSTRFGCEVGHFKLRGQQARHLETSQGAIEADAYVIAAGLASRTLAQSIGDRLPLYPVKGYSLTLRIKDSERAPRTNVTDLQTKTVFAPLGPLLRVAARAELVSKDLSIPAARIAHMLETVERLFPGACDLAEPRPWAGLRPCTPDSVPIVRPSAACNVFINAGHGALGFTLAAGSARLLADLMASAGPAPTRWRCPR